MSRRSKRRSPRSERKRSGKKRKSPKRSRSTGRVSTKKNPKLWEQAKKKACTKANLCVHSARKMQWATRYYKSKGGKYIGKKSKNNSLSKWGRQKWRTSSGRKSGGKLRYLPDKAWKNLSKDQIRRTNASKRKGYKKGKQFVPQPRDVRKISKKYRGITRTPISCKRIPINCNRNHCSIRKKTCVRKKDGKIFSLPRKYSRKECKTKTGFSARASCAAYK